MVDRWKRAVTVAGHRTSVSLDPVFWNLLAAWARARGLSRNALITEIDVRRWEQQSKQGAASSSLSSAIRVAVLAAVRAGVIESAPREDS